MAIGDEYKYGIDKNLKDVMSKVKIDPSKIESGNSTTNIIDKFKNNVKNAAINSSAAGFIYDKVSPVVKKVGKAVEDAIANSSPSYEKIAEESNKKLNEYQQSKRMDEIARNQMIKNGLIYGGAGLGLAGLGILTYNLLKDKKKERKMKMSFNEEFCENKALVSAANTVDMIALIDPVNYSEYSAGLISKLSNTPYNYVVNVMNEVADFNANFSEEGVELFNEQIAGIYDHFNKDIIQCFSEYLNSSANFDEDAAEAKVEDLSELISLLDEKTIKELGPDYVAGVISSATDTNADLLKSTIIQYINTSNIEDYKNSVDNRLSRIENAIEQAQAKTDAAENAVDVAKNVAQESFSEVFIKKNGKYYKFNDATVTVPIHNFATTDINDPVAILENNIRFPKPDYSIIRQAGPSLHPIDLAGRAFPGFNNDKLNISIDEVSNPSYFTALKGDYRDIKDNIKNAIGWNNLDPRTQSTIKYGGLGALGAGAAYGAYKLLKKKKKND